MNEAEKEPEYSSNSELNEYTFDNFIVGESNKFAHDVAFAVAEGRNNQFYNPLFIYGESGLGKTHLLHVIRHLATQKYPNRNALYVTGNDFVDDLMSCILQDKGKEFREKYSSPDILLMDDIQYLVGKPTIQQELLYIYNTLRERDKQIIITSDKPVSEMYHVVDALRTRFISGIQVQMNPPDKALRIAIINHIAKSFHVVLPYETVNCFADNLDSNIRQLEGAVKMTIAYKSLNDKDIDIEFAKIVVSMSKNENCS